MRVIAIILCGLALASAAAGAWLYTPDLSRAVLNAKYRTGPADTRMVARIGLHLRDTGPRGAPAIILLHGFGSSLQTWDAWADKLSVTYRVIRFDLPGFGLTGPDPTGDYTDARSEAILLALMNDLGLAKASLIGNSMGGRIAWRFAADHPERVEKLVLVSPDGFASPGFAYDQPPDVPFLMRLLPYILPRAMLRASLLPAYADPARLTEATVTRYRDMMLAPGNRAAMIARLRQARITDPRPALHRITAPTLLLWGEQDRMIPFSNAADYLRAIPHATLVPLPGLGHVPFEESPAASLAPVETFLAK